MKARYFIWLATFIPIAFLVLDNATAFKEEGENDNQGKLFKLKAVLLEFDKTI